MNYNVEAAEFEIERLQSRVNHLTVTNHNARQLNKELIGMLEHLSDMMLMLDEQTHPQIELDAVKHDIDELIKKAKGES